MAEEVIREKAPGFNLGIESTSVLGDIEAAEAFLSGTETVTGKAKEIEKAEEEDLEKKKNPDSKKKAEEKPDPNKLITNLLDEGEGKTNEEEEEEEEEKIKEKKAEAEKEKGTKDNEDPELNTFEAFSEELYNIGAFTVEEGKDPILAKTPEEFLELFNEEKKLGATTWLENFLSKHGEDRRELFDAIFVNGVDPKKYLPVYNEVEDLEGLDIEKEENQESVVRAYYIRMGWSKEEVEEKVTKLKQYADLESESKKVHPKLIQQDKQKLEKMAEEEGQKNAQIAADDEAYKKSLATVLQAVAKTKDFDGIPMDDKKAAQAFDFLYTKKWKLPSGELLTDFDKFVLESKDPSNISARIKIALLKIDGFDFSKIQKKAVSTQSNKLFSKLATKEVKKSNSEKQVVENPAWSTL